MPEEDTTKYCPACHQGYSSLDAVKEHLKKAISEPDALDYETHVAVYYGEGWDETPLAES